MKDNFSVQSDDYVKFRPAYPQSLIDYLVGLTHNRNRAWDCGTGNGQLAAQIAISFEEVYATDISERQLANAHQKANISYSCQSAEKTSFSEKFFDLITVAQAAHWFDHSKFNEEVKRVAKPDAVIALIGYGLLQVNADAIQEVIDHFYWNITRPYWDPERNHIEAAYHTIPFPFREIAPVPKFKMTKEMTLDALVGYISTWSAVQHFIRSNGYSPIPKLKAELQNLWKTDYSMVSFPLFMRVGRV